MLRRRATSAHLMVVDRPHAEGPSRPLPRTRHTSATTSHQDDYVFAESRRHRWVPLLRSLLQDSLTFSACRMTKHHPDHALQVVVKEPSGSEVAALLLEAMPGSRVIFLVRDGRDVVASWLAAYRPAGWILDEGGYPLAADGRLAFITWQADVWRYRTEAVQQAFDGMPPERRLLVR